MPVSSTTNTRLESRLCAEPGSPPPSSFSATILPSASSSLTQESWTFGSAMWSMSMVMTVPAARLTL